MTWINSLLDGAPIEWHLLGQSLVGAAFMAILLPLALRFGLKLWTILFASVISSAGSFLFGGISEIHNGWWAATSVTVLATVWWISYRLLGTPHPWRANAMKGLTPARRM
ncbi:MAG: hypothetical protein RLZZ398_2222 [Verrucomicrobiota bacterium]|jgi:hypothetical protein